jgi:hypothetical protein
MKKQLLLILFILLNASLFETNAFSGNGNGTSESPYVIATVEQLNEVRNDLSASYILEADIDLANWINTNSPEAGWEPLGFGTLEDPHPFTGSFDGNGHFITGLWVNRPDNNYIGLFGQVTGTVEFKNLGVIIAEGKSVKGKECVAGIAGWLTNIETTNVAKFNNCFVMGNIEGTKNVGAIVGLNNWVHPTLENCYAAGSVISTGDGAGGLMGSSWGNTEITIKNCYSINSVKSSESGSAAGILGSASANNAPGIYLSIFNCAAINPTIDGGTARRIHSWVKSGANISLGKNMGYEGTSVNGDEVWFGYDDNNEGEDVNAEQIKDKNTYTDWDFTDIWAMGNEQYPLPVLKILSKNFQPVTCPSHIPGFTAIEKIASEVSVIYPNPTAGELFIKNKPSGLKAKLFDCTGKLLLTSTEDNLNISSFNSGVYFIRIDHQVITIVKR